MFHQIEGRQSINQSICFQWIQDGQTQGSGVGQQTVVKIEGGSHQFVPTNTDPAEFKRKQKEVRKGELGRTRILRNYSKCSH